MKILIFTEGTILMHKNAKGHSRDEIVQQVEQSEKSVSKYADYIPVGNAVEKLNNWKSQGAEIIYLTSRRKPKEIEDIQSVLDKFNFPDGKLLFRDEKLKEYKDVAESVMPDILLEDDCESIGGVPEMTITNVEPSLKKQIKSIPVKEFGGIDHLPVEISKLLSFPFVILIRGALGIGKSTISKKLLDKINAHYVSIDEVLSKNELDKIEGRCISAANFVKGNEIALPDIFKNLVIGKSVVIDGCFYHKEQIEHFKEKIDVPVYVFTLRASVETCIARDSKREKSYGEGAAIAVHSLVSEFDYGTIIETENKTVDMVLTEILSYLPSKK